MFYSVLIFIYTIMKNKKNVAKVCFSVIIATIALFNINIVSETNAEKGYLSLLSAEALASDNEWNNWIDWFDQGFTKDESERVVDCQPGNNTSKVELDAGGTINGVYVGGSISYEDSTPGGTSHITCAYGDENCTPTDC